MNAVADYLNTSETLTFRFASALRAADIGGFIACLNMDEGRAFVATAAFQMPMISERAAHAVGRALYTRGELADSKGYTRLGDIYSAAQLAWNGAGHAYRREQRIAA